VDDPAEIDSVYDDPPATTEQLLHGPGAGPEANLPVEVASGDWESASRRRTTFGELFLRGTLATRLSEEAAADAAAGWGTDERLVFTRDGETGYVWLHTGYVWLHRWDDAANATEFQRAFDSYLNRTLNRSTVAGPDGPTAGWRGDGETYRLLRLDDQTTALVAGSPAFVGNTTLDDQTTALVAGSPAFVGNTTLQGDGDSVAVRVGNESGAQTPNNNGTPKTTNSPTSATSVPTPTAPAPNDCIGLVRAGTERLHRAGHAVVVELTVVVVGVVGHTRAWTTGILEDFSPPRQPGVRRQPRAPDRRSPTSRAGRGSPQGGTAA
jgi:hypothetical protein